VLRPTQSPEPDSSGFSLFGFSHILDRMAHILRRFTITKEPRGLLYRNLLTFALPLCNQLVMVVREPDKLSDYWRAVQSKLKPFLIEQTKANEWPGTQCRAKVDLFRYRFEAASAGIFARAAHRLYEWVEPRLPEDLSLLRPDDRPWLVVIAHERDAYIDMTDEEMLELTAKLPNLQLKLEQEPTD
jgi:hypothetical protein